MDRRDVLKSVMSTVGGAGLIAAGGGALAAEEQTSRVSPTKGRPVAFRLAAWPLKRAPDE